MKLLIIDIETTGFVPQGQSIVEIGIVLCDSDTRETIPVFNQIVRDDEFDYNKHKNAWIFQNSDLNIEKVMAARGVKGARIYLGGRLAGAEIARSEQIKRGSIPLQTFPNARKYERTRTTWSHSRSFGT